MDLVPPFAPGTFAYDAVLDFAMPGFSVDARAQDGCEADGVPNEAIPVQVAGAYTLTVFASFAKSTDPTARQAYVLKVTRLSGAETELQYLRVASAQLQPTFSPEVRGYAATMDVSQDLIRVSYVPRDNGQQLLLAASSEDAFVPPTMLPTLVPTRTPTREPTAVPITARRLTAAAAEVAAGSAWGAGAGEVQYLERTRSFLVDPGRGRSVSFTVRGADPESAATATYVLAIHRIGCPAQRPLFSPASQSCTLSCPSRFYANTAAHRCSECNDNCAICTSLSHCELCLDDTVRHRHVLQPDGSCSKQLVAVEDTYRWWCVGFAMCIGLLVCAGMVVLCECLCAWCGGYHKRGSSYGTDSDDEFAYKG